MPIVLRNGYYVSDDLTHTPSIGIDSSRLAKCISRAKKKRYKSVFGHPTFGFNGSDLDFLSELPWVEAVWFWDVNLKNIDGLYTLTELRHFGIHPRRPPVDFSHFPKLQKLIIEPRARDRGIGALQSLELLHIWHYRPRTKDFATFEIPETVSELEINWANASSLETLPPIKGLRRLEVHRCRNLETLGDLPSKYPNLEHLIVAACGKVMEGEGERVVRDLPRLRFAYVKNKVIVEAAG